MSNGPSLTYAEVAAWLGRSVTYIERLVARNAIPHHRSSANRVWFDREEIRQWIKERSVSDTRIQPVRPLHGGAQSVYPSDTIGGLSTCWCGEPIGHDWPGKKSGAPHPHTQERKQVVVVQRSEENPPRIEKRDLRGYHGTLKDFITNAVNTDGLRYRIGTNEVLLYPPDDSRPISVYARNNDSQIKSLRQWYNAHVEPFNEPVEQASVRELAETLNDPVEHPVEVNQSTGSPEAKVQAEAQDGDGWRPYVTDAGDPVPNFETNGTLYRCRECLGTEFEYVSDRRNGIGGHNRMRHTDTTSLFSEEGIAKNVDSRRFNRLSRQVQKAVEDLAAATGMSLGDGEEVERLRAEVAEQRKRAEDAEAKLALMREAFEGLS